jgi:hypothetical protein
MSREVIGRASAVLLCSIGLSGCAARRHDPPGLVNVRAPGVNVRVGPGGHTQVRAPGTRVTAGPGGAVVEPPVDDLGISD